MDDIIVCKPGRTDIWADTLTPPGRQRIKEAHTLVCDDSLQ